MLKIEIIQLVPYTVSICPSVSSCRLLILSGRKSCQPGPRIVATVCLGCNLILTTLLESAVSRTNSEHRQAKLTLECDREGD